MDRKYTLEQQIGMLAASRESSGAQQAGVIVQAIFGTEALLLEDGTPEVIDETLSTSWIEQSTNVSTAEDLFFHLMTIFIQGVPV